MRRALDTINLLKKTRLSSSNTAVKLIIAVAVSMALVFIVYIGRVPYGSQPQIGKVSDKTIYAPFDFSYDAGNDTERTEELKRIAALSVKDVYDINADVFENTALKVSAFFSALYELEGAGEINLQDEVNRLTINGGLGLSESTIKALLESGEPERLESVLLSRLENLYSQGIISPEEKESLISQGKTAVIVRNPNTRNELKVDISGLKTPDELKPQLTSLFDESIPDDKLLKDALAEIAGKVLAANLKSDIVEISSRREKAIASVLPQKKLIDVKKDEGAGVVQRAGEGAAGPRPGRAPGAQGAGDLRGRALRAAGPAGVRQRGAA